LRNEAAESITVTRSAINWINQPVPWWPRLPLAQWILLTNDRDIRPLFAQMAFEKIMSMPICLALKLTGLPSANIGVPAAPLKQKSSERVQDSFEAISQPFSLLR
jgi:hypothetical protein